MQKLLEWKKLALLARKPSEELQTHYDARTRHRTADETDMRDIVSQVVEQESWQDEESTVAWERYMQAEGLCQHVHCQFCDSTEKPLAVVTQDKQSASARIASARIAGASLISTTVRTNQRTYPSSKSFTQLQANFIVHSHTLKRSTQDEYADR